MFRDYLNGEISWPHYCGPDVAALRERLNLTQEALAALLKVSPKTIFRWESEAEALQPNYCIALCMLDKLGDGVFTLMDQHQKHFTLEAAPERRDNLTGISLILSATTLKPIAGSPAFRNPSTARPWRNSAAGSASPAGDSPKNFRYRPPRSTSGNKAT